MRQSQLKAFHNVALHNGFSRAARAMNISQPAISEQVRKLEQAFDVLLFNRLNKQVSLTPLGVKLFVLTRQLFEVEDEIAELLGRSRTSMGDRLGIIVDSAHHISDLLARFRSKYPQVFVTMRIGNTQEVLTALRCYEAEIGVVGCAVSDMDLLARPLGATRIVAIASKGFPLPHPGALTLQEVAKLPLVFREKGSKTRQRLLETANRQGVKLVPAIEVEGREALRDVVASGAGIGFVSEAEFGFDTRLVQIPLQEPDLLMQETLICLRQRHDVRGIRTFMEMANEQEE